MPVTAKLSRRFYETFGDEITNELVEWFNLVDRTYRTELRELNDINFGRFDTRLGQGLSHVRQEMAAGFADVRREMAGEFADVRREMEAGFARVDAKIADVRRDTDAGFARADARLEQRLAELKAELLKWMFVFWVGQTATTVVLLITVVKLIK